MRQFTRMNGVMNGVILAVTMAVLLAFAHPAMAVQYRMVEGDTEISAAISLKEVSRIALRDDRIAGVVHLPRGFGVEHDAETGDIFMVPMAGLVDTAPINLFITSEQGRTYQLLLTPLDIPSEQIIILGPRRVELAKDTAPRRQELARLMRAMITGVFLDDYTRQAPVPADLDGFNPVYEHLEILEVWQGDRFRGIHVALEIGRHRFVNADMLADSAAAGWMSPDGRKAIIVVEASDGR